MWLILCFLPAVLAVEECNSSTGRHTLLVLCRDTDQSSTGTSKDLVVTKNTIMSRWGGGLTKI